MINTEELKNVTCHVIAVEGNGTGIFVSATEIFTCRHILKNLNVGDQVKGRLGVGEEFNGKIKALCEKTDLALIDSDYKHTAQAVLVDCEMQIGTVWACHGHPNTSDGKTVGAPLRGQVTHIIKDSALTIHDISLSVEGIRLDAKYSGYSGSGVINSKGKVISILRYKNDNYLSAVSIRKGLEFLRNNNITVQEGTLDDFSEIITEAFSSLDEGIRSICLATGRKVADVLSPQMIIDTLNGSIFYPGERCSVRDLITRLVNNNDVNKALWLGWLRFLTYIALLKGEYKEVNKISISLGIVELSKLMGVEVTPIPIPLTVTLKFFFTENSSFVSIAKEYIYDKFESSEFSPASCHIFESSNSLFGIKRLSAQEKRNIVLDISGGEGGMVVPEKLHFGILSLHQLSRAIAESENLTEATNNLKNLFKDVLI